MSVKIGINGMGRIGKLAFRAVFENPKLKDVEVVAVNDIVSIESTLYKIKYDSTHGKLMKDIKIDGNYLVIEGKKTRVMSSRDPKELDWSDVDCLLECTGQYLTTEKAQAHMDSGAPRVVMSAPAKDDITPTFVLGVNEETYSSSMNIISNASCTTNCLSPIVKVLEDNLGVEEGFMATIHAATLSQNVIDGNSKKKQREGRSALGNIIPTTTGATKAVAKVIPSVKGKLTGISYRVPVQNVSMVDFTVRLKKETSLEEIHQLIKRSSQERLKDILEYCDEEVVSSDMNHNFHSSIYDSKACIGLNKQFFKLISWYDNEWGYANRLVEMGRHIVKNG